MGRPFSLFLVLAFVVAACGAESVDTTAPPTTGATPEAVLLSYELEPGTAFGYEVEFEQHITMNSSGDSSAIGEDEMPGNVDVEVSGVTTFTHTVEEGIEPGTFDITILGDFSDLAVTGTVDGEPVDPEEISDLAGLEPVETTITVDEQGNLISGDKEDLALGGPLSGPRGFGGLATPGMELGTLVGPSLPEREVTVGDTWSETIENSMPFGDDAITTVENEVTGTDIIDGAEVFVIETTSSTSLIKFDLGFLAGFMPEEATAEERAELEAMMEDQRFVMTVQPSSFLTTTWFDPGAGHAPRSESTGSTQMSFDINFPDEGTGEMVAFTMEMTIDHKIAYRLLSAGSA